MSRFGTQLIHRLRTPPSRLRPTPSASRLSSSSSSPASSPGLRSRSRTPPPFPYPTTQSCSAATCPCRETPDLPPDLPIDRKTNLNGAMPAYREMVLVCTGHSGWPSRIEEENGGDNLAADLKELLGRGGEYSNPYNPITILSTSFPATPSTSPLQTTSAYILPTFTYIPHLPRLSFAASQALTKAYLLPQTLHPSQETDLSPLHRDRLRRDDKFKEFFPDATPVDDVLVLSCAHGERDMRCGIMGPVLADEFRDKISDVGGLILEGPVSGPDPDDNGHILPPGEEALVPEWTARVGLVSHVGGHKFAGNIIIYIPPGMLLPSTREKHPLAGCGVWYGRVEPIHVEGIVRDTIVGGKIIEEFFRGGIDSDRRIMRM